MLTTARPHDGHPALLHSVAAPKSVSLCELDHTRLPFDRRELSCRKIGAQP